MAQVIMVHPGGLTHVAREFESAHDACDFAFHLTSDIAVDGHPAVAVEVRVEGGVVLVHFNVASFRAAGFTWLMRTLES